MKTTKLRLTHLEQLDTYLEDVKSRGWYYGNKEQFIKRHEDLQRWIDSLIEEKILGKAQEK